MFDTRCDGLRGDACLEYMRVQCRQEDLGGDGTINLQAGSEVTIFDQPNFGGREIVDWYADGQGDSWRLWTTGKPFGTSGHRGQSGNSLDNCKELVASAKIEHAGTAVH
jgi:hypothetical protein